MFLCVRSTIPSIHQALKYISNIRKNNFFCIWVITELLGKGYAKFNIKINKKYFLFVSIHPLLSSFYSNINCNCHRWDDVQYHHHHCQPIEWNTFISISHQFNSVYTVDSICRLPGGRDYGWGYGIRNS